MHSIDYKTMNVQELAKFTKKQELLYKQLRESNSIEDSIDAEEIYANSRALFFKKLRITKKQKSSENLHELLQKEDAAILPKRELPISKLNFLLRNQEETELNIAGGISDGGFFGQVVAQSGGGKSTLLMALCLGLSATNKVAWLDYERGWLDYKRALLSFTARSKKPFNTKNVDYLDGFKASDELSFILEEITLLAHTGVKDFFIDSFMVIKINGESDSASWAKSVSLALQSTAKEFGINIWVINQISAKDEEVGRRQPIYGHASRYASDYMFFIQKIPKLTEDGRVVKDDVGQPIFDETKRLFTCDKNRYDHNFGEGSIEITEADIFGEQNEPFEIIYDENDNEYSNGNIDLPMI